MDIDRGIRVAVDTGTTTLGSDKSVQALKLGKGKLVIIAKNCPVEVREDVMYYSKLSEVPVYTYEGSSVDLGSVCGKPFTVATLIIKDPGDSTILEVMG
ncbi:MAG: 50S ribosomal protein L30e [Methanobacterium sp.]